MKQSDTLVARAIVGYEVDRLARGGGESPLPTVSAATIIAKYKLDWGLYGVTDRYTYSRAAQLLRNELNTACREGRLQRAGKDGTWTLYAKGEA